MIGEIEKVLQRFGFEPLQSPVLELHETLMGKYGPDAEKLIYDAQHREGKEELLSRLGIDVGREIALQWRAKRLQHNNKSIVPNDVQSA